jgi:PAS domain S-box-containing protein
VQPHRDGTTRTILSSVSLLKDRAGNMTGAVGINRDITDRKQADLALKRSSDRLRVLATASQTFAEVGVDYQTLLERIAQMTVAALGEGCGISLISDDREWLQTVVLYDVDPERGELLPIILGDAPHPVDEPSLTTRVFLSSQPLLIPVIDQNQLRAATQPAYQSLIDGLAMHSLLGVPMRVQGRTIGVLILYRHQPDRPPFDTDDLTLAQDLADRAALAIGNARLLAQVQRELAERTKAEAALRESEELLRAVTNTAQVGLVIVDQEHRYRYANPAYATIFRLPTAEIVGRRVADVLAPVYGAQIRPRLERAFGGERVSYELVVPPARTYAVTYEPGVYRSIPVVVVVVVDITDRTRAEQALQRYADRLQHLRAIDQAILASHSLAAIAEAAVTHIGHLIPTTRIGVTLLDVDTQTMTLLALQVYGALRTPASVHTPLGIFGAAIESLMHGQPYQVADVAALPELPAFIRMGQAEQLRAYFHMPIMAGHELIGLLNVGADQPDAFSAEHIDIAREVADQLSIAIQQTRLRAQVERHAQDLEQRVVARTAELTAANKELEAFSYSVSHDLRAPLRAIDGFSRILQEEYVAALPEEAQHYFQLVRDSAQQMGQLVDDLLAFARLSRQPLSTRSVDPAALVRQCLDELHAEQAGRRIEIHIGELPDCQGDRALLKQVWINLLANALKYSRTREPAVIDIASRTENGETIYFVKDNGVGFDMRYSGKLFGVFQRMHRAEEYEGTGVGLAIVQRIIHRHGGRIWADAAVDRGAAFYFTLGEHAP